MTDSKTAKSRAWFFPTSPRSPYKIKPELQLLKEVSHLPWSRDEGQLEFSKLLFKARSFEGGGSRSEPTFSARDRTRAPQMLGLVVKTGRGASTKLKLTNAGEEFLQLGESEEAPFFLNQVAKVQFPSAFHSAGGFSEMDCRPLTVALKILLTVGPVTKEEFGLFILTCIRHEHVDSAISGIQEFRQKIRREAPGISKKQRKDDLINLRVEEVYASDIAAGHTSLREGGGNFIATKRQTLIQDYADSSFRYLLATGLFRIEPHGRTFSVVESKRDFAQSLVDELGLGSTYSDFTPHDYAEAYLGSTLEPRLSALAPEVQAKKVRQLLRESNTPNSKAEEAIAELLTEPRGYKRELLVDSVYAEKRLESLTAKSVQLVENRSTVTAQILETFQEIVSRESGMLDKPLFFEWNTWRAFTALNDAINVIGNFRCDAEGNPLGTASGKQPDIIAEYQSFWLAVEVTLQRGHKQYEAESESITRHVGEFQARLRESGDARPIFGVFIAPKINETVLNYLMTQANMNSTIYRGPVKIAPLDLADFQQFVSRQAGLLTTNSEKLRIALDAVFDASLVGGGDEPGWFDSVSETFRNLELA